MLYNKPVTLIDSQIKLLQARGLQIKDIDQARHCLSTISYYRLAGYWWPMQSDKVSHVFKSNSKFEDVIFLYNFDRELRLLLFDVIERIEIALRTKMRFPPSIKTLEITSFGSLSKCYGNLKPTVRSKDIIAREFNTVNHTFLPSWLQSIAQIRNVCAHHGRLWNKSLPGRPNLLPKPPAPWLSSIPNSNERQMIYVHLCCMKYLLNVASPGNHFTARLSALLHYYPSVDIKALGIPANWEKEALWRMNGE